MLTSIQKWGNSQGLRFPKVILEEAHLSVGDDVNLSVHDGKIVVEPIRKVRDKYEIQALVAQMPNGYQAEEMDWGAPVGKEVW